MGYPNTSNFVKNTPLHVVFSTLFSVFGYPDETLSLVFDLLHEKQFSRLASLYPNAFYLHEVYMCKTLA